MNKNFIRVIPPYIKNGHLYRRGVRYSVGYYIIGTANYLEELCRRIAPAYGRQKATSVVRDKLQSIIIHYLKRDAISTKDSFISIKDFVDIKVRVPNPDDDYLRPINYICDEELALAMKTIAQHSFGIKPDDLFIVTAREFGFKRTGENIINSLLRVYQQMLKKGEVTEVDGKVQIVS